MSEEHETSKFPSRAELMHERLERVKWELVHSQELAAFSVQRFAEYATSAISYVEYEKASVAALALMEYAKNIERYVRRACEITQQARSELVSGALTGEYDYAEIGGLLDREWEYGQASKHVARKRREFEQEYERESEAS